MQTDNSKYTVYFIALLLIVTGIRLIVIGLSLVTPQEAYYWNYSRHPDWSYFDHPAAASLLIKFGTSIFGNDSFGVRFGGVLLSSIMAIVTFLFARTLFTARAAFYSVLLLNVIWIFAVGAVVTTPDTPFIFFWVLNILLIYYAEKHGSLSLFMLWGLSAGLGFDSKYIMAMAFPSALLYLLFSGELRRLKIWIYFAIGCLVSFIAALPVFYWNYIHDWASFAFQTTRRANEMASFRFDMFFGFLGSQLGIVTPFIFPFVIYAVYKAGKKGFYEADNRYKLLFCFSAPIILFFTLSSFRGWVKMNWPVAGYYPAIIAMCAIFENKISPKPDWMRRRWRKYALFATTFAVALSVISYIHSFFPVLPMGKADTMVGWRDLGKLTGLYTGGFLKDNPDNIIGYEYKAASEAAFYTRGNPDTKSDNYVGGHGLSYRFWSDPELYTGGNFLFIYDSRYRFRPESRLLKYFQYTEPERPLKIYGIGGELFYIHFIRCYGYKGPNG